MHPAPLPAADPAPARATPGKRLAQAERLLPFLFGGGFVLFSALFVLGHYQNHAGDFGQYAVQARNLVLGRSWDHLVAGFPSVPPAYSFLLAVVTWIGGFNAYHYALLNSVLWAGCAIAAFHLFRDAFRHRATAYVFLLAVLFTPLVVAFQQNGIPNILYAAACLFALLAAKKLSEGPFRLLPAACILLPALVRSEALALYGALFIWFALRRQWKLAALPVLGVVLLLVSDLLLSLNYDLVSNFRIVARLANLPGGESAQGRGFDPLRLLAGSAYMFLSYLSGFAEYFMTNAQLQAQKTWQLPVGTGLVVRTGPVSVALVLLAAAGIAAHRKFLSLDKVFLATHLALLSAFLLLRGVPARYLLPILPIFIFYAVFALERAWSLLRVPAPALPVLTLAPIAFAFSLSIPAYMAAPARSNSLFSPHMGAVADWVAQNRQGRPVAYFKDRLMTLLLDLRSDDAVQAVGVRSPAQVDAMLRRNGLIVLRKYKRYNQQQLLEGLQANPDAELVWEDAMHAVFAARRGPDGVPLAARRAAEAPAGDGNAPDSDAD